MLDFQNVIRQAHVLTKNDDASQVRERCLLDSPSSWRFNQDRKYYLLLSFPKLCGGAFRTEIVSSEKTGV